jgi:hypothetical protein
LNPVLLIQVISALMEVAPKGVSLYRQIEAVLEASDEPEAKAALARLRSTYGETGAAADAALDEALHKAP